MSNIHVSQIATEDYAQLPLGHTSVAIVLTRCDLCGLAIGFRRPALACHHCSRPLCTFCANVLGIPGAVKTTSISPSPLRNTQTARHTYKGDLSKVNGGSVIIDPNYLTSDSLPSYMESLGPSPSPPRDRLYSNKQEPNGKVADRVEVQEVGSRNPSPSPREVADANLPRKAEIAFIPRSSSSSGVSELEDGEVLYTEKTIKAEEGEGNCAELVGRHDGVTTLTTPLSDNEAPQANSRKSNMFMKDSSDDGDLSEGDRKQAATINAAMLPRPPSQVFSLSSSPTTGIRNRDLQSDGGSDVEGKTLRPIDDPDNPLTVPTRRTLRRFKEFSTKGVVTTYRSCNGRDSDCGVFSVKKFSSKMIASKGGAMTSFRSNGDNDNSNFDNTTRADNNDFTQTFSGGVASSSLKVCNDSNYGGSSEEGEDDENLEQMLTNKPSVIPNATLAINPVTHAFGPNNNHGAPEERISILQHCLGALSNSSLTPNVQRVCCDALGYRHHQLSEMRSSDVPHGSATLKLIAAIPFGGVASAPTSSPKSSVNNRQLTSSNSFRAPPVTIAKFWCGECDLSTPAVVSDEILFVGEAANSTMATPITTSNRLLNGPPISPNSSPSSNLNRQSSFADLSHLGVVTSPSPTTGPSSFFGPTTHGTNNNNSGNLLTSHSPASSTSQLASPPTSGNSHSPTALREPPMTSERFKGISRCQVCSKKFDGALLSVFTGKKCQCGSCGKVVCENKCCREVVRTLVSLPPHLKRTLGYTSPALRPEGSPQAQNLRVHTDPASPSTMSVGPPTSTEGSPNRPPFPTSHEIAPTILLAEANVRRLRNGMVALYMCNGCMLGQ